MVFWSWLILHDFDIFEAAINDQVKPDHVIEGSFGSWRNFIKEGYGLEYFEVSKKQI